MTESVLDTITTVDVTRFENSVFVLIKLNGISFSKKVSDYAALLAYFDQWDKEIEAKKLAGEDVSQYDGAGAVPNIPRGSLKGNKKRKPITVSKTLLYSPALDALREHLTAAKAAIVSPPQYGGIANPSGIIEGLFEISKDLVDRVKSEISEANRRLTQPWLDDELVSHPGLLTAFLDDYEAAIERARTAPVLQGGLGPLFNPLDYPSRGKVATSFGISKRLISIGVPDNLVEEAKEEARQELREDFRNAAEEIKSALRIGFAQLLNHAHEVLMTQPGQKPKIIKESLIGNILQFCDTFQFRNTQGDTQLAALVEECRLTLSGVDPAELRKNGNAREDAARAFATISSRVDEMIVEEKGRRFDLE